MVQDYRFHMSPVYPGVLFCNLDSCLGGQQDLEGPFHLGCSSDLQENDLIQIQSPGSKG